MSAAATTATGDGWQRLRRTRTRVTKRAVLHVVLGGLLYVSGSNVGAGWVVALAGIVLGVVPWAWVSARRSGARVEVRRQLPTESIDGSPATVTFELRAPTSAAIVVHDVLSGAAGVVEDPRAGGRLDGAVRLRRGVLADGPVEATVTDLFGLVRVTAAAPVASSAEVLPATPRVRRPERLARRDGDEEAAARRGGGPDLLGIREHVPGDPLRSVHWRSTARQQRLVVREFEEPQRPSVLIRLAAATWPQDALDTATTATAGLASSLAGSGQEVQVSADGSCLPWGRAAHRLLAALPPHAAAAPRPLEPSADGGEIELLLSPAPPAGVGVELRTHEQLEPLGVLPVDGSVDPGDWLTARLAAQGGS